MYFIEVDAIIHWPLVTLYLLLVVSIVRSRGYSATVWNSSIYLICLELQLRLVLFNKLFLKNELRHNFLDENRWNES